MARKLRATSINGRATIPIPGGGAISIYRVLVDGKGKGGSEWESRMDGTDTEDDEEKEGAYEEKLFASYPSRSELSFHFCLWGGRDLGPSRCDGDGNAPPSTPAHLSVIFNTHVVCEVELSTTLTFLIHIYRVPNHPPASPQNISVRVNRLASRLANAHQITSPSPPKRTCFRLDLKGTGLDDVEADVSTSRATAYARLQPSFQFVCDQGYTKGRRCRRRRSRFKSLRNNSPRIHDLQLKQYQLVAFHSLWTWKLQMASVNWLRLGLR
ncbi:hypothetical protein M422DRAFT_258960 [Sphaerobolus stellatus SS14]|uniref:Uncharacterized protein n=1 Tax=Sphaerobolus stellatus (strain SS14) TaxID=990650 RepID=A0A0C9V9X4_SPHS4|nr:hypothetical protein M422DRAFT_258960 [Sphaerobolus stellatus SS14]